MNLLLVGCGKMGGALLGRWQQSHPPGVTHFDVVAPHHAHSNTGKVAWHKNLESLPAAFAPHIIVFAVKPQNLAELLPAYGARFGVKPLYISVAAGKTLDFYRGHLGEHAHIVRAMPNTPALIGEGMTVLCALSTLPESARHTATVLMQAVGKVEWLEDEAQMDAATAISGCGPAYAFLFLEALTKAGMAAGLHEGTARLLALETLAGSVALTATSREGFEQLRKNVASPGGSTEAALKVLMQADAFEKLIENAVLAAAKRSKELAK